LLPNPWTLYANINSGYDKRYEVVGLRKDGSTYPLAIRGKNVNYKGRPVRVIEFNDITELKKAEERLIESKNLLSRAQEISHTGSWELDLSTNRLTWSDETYRILGCSPQEFPATYDRLFDFIHPEDRDEGGPGI
jgi:PAS domain-containing protein